MKIKVLKDKPERVLGALSLFVAGLIILAALLFGAFENKPMLQSSDGEKGKDSVVININTAEKKELKQLDGISDEIAENILKYREEKGDFESVDDLLQVKGIGEKKLKDIRNYIRVK